MALYQPTNYPASRLGNTPTLDQLVRDGKIYLSLSNAVLLALENNFDIAIARINLDIADTDILRARAGSTLRGVSTGLVSGTLGGSGTTVTGGGGPAAPPTVRAAEVQVPAVLYSVPMAADPFPKTWIPQ